MEFRIFVVPGFYSNGSQPGDQGGVILSGKLETFAASVHSINSFCAIAKTFSMEYFAVRTQSANHIQVEVVNSPVETIARHS